MDIRAAREAAGKMVVDQKPNIKYVMIRWNRRCIGLSFGALDDLNLWGPGCDYPGSRWPLILYYYIGIVLFRQGAGIAEFVLNSESR
jgi:hypothetical protein